MLLLLSLPSRRRNANPPVTCQPRGTKHRFAEARRPARARKSLLSRVCSAATPVGTLVCVVLLQPFTSGVDGYIEGQKRRVAMRWVTVVFGSLFILFGAALFLGGITLVRLGGSSCYVIVGIGLIASGIQLLRQRASGVWLYALVVSGTLIWSLAESRLSMWGLLPRLATFVGLGAAFAAALAWTRPQLAGAGLRWGGPMVSAGGQDA